MSSFIDTKLIMGVADVEINAEAATHPNRIPFSGILTRVDKPSDKAPNGSNGHRVMIPKATAQAALATLVGMGVNAGSNLRKHDVKKKIGVITKAEIKDDAIVVTGHLFGHDFSEEIKKIQALARENKLGMSFEITSVSIENVDADVWVVEELIFTGASILERNAAAYTTTDLAASSQKGSSVKTKIELLQDSLKEIAAEMEQDKQSDDSKKETTDNTQNSNDMNEVLKMLVASALEDKKSDKKSDDQQAATPGFKTQQANMLKQLMNEAMESMLMKSMKMKTGDDSDYGDGQGFLMKMLEKMMMQQAGGGVQAEKETKDDKAKDTDLAAQIASLTEKVNALAAQVQPGDEKKTDDDKSKTDDKKVEAKSEDQQVEAKSEDQQAAKDVDDKIDEANKKETPERKTKVVDTSVFASKFGIEPKKEGKYSMEEFNEALNKAGVNATQRMAMKMDAAASGILE